jgi:alkylation response protein AidB-like acyl-CoA dehydrogenase
VGLGLCTPLNGTDRFLGISDPSKGYKGISCFVVEREWGVQIAKKEKKVRTGLGITPYARLDLNLQIVDAFVYLSLR